MKLEALGHGNTSAQVRFTSVAIRIQIWIRDPGCRSPPKFNHLFIGSLPTFPENFMQNRSQVFAQSC